MFTECRHRDVCNKIISAREILAFISYWQWGADTESKPWMMQSLVLVLILKQCEVKLKVS